MAPQAWRQEELRGPRLMCKRKTMPSKRKEQRPTLKRKTKKPKKMMLRPLMVTKKLRLSRVKLKLKMLKLRRHLKRIQRKSDRKISHFAVKRSDRRDAAFLIF